MKSSRHQGTLVGVCLAAGILTLNAGLAQVESGSPQAAPPPPLPFGTEGPEYREAVEKAMARFPSVEQDPVMRFIRQEFPREIYELQRIARHDVEEATDYVSDLVSEALAMLDAKEEDPERFKLLIEQRHLERNSMDLARALRDLEEARQPEVRKQLLDTLEKAFDVRQKLMQMELTTLEQDIAELRELIERRHTKRAAIIQHRMDELTGTLEELEW